MFPDKPEPVSMAAYVDRLLAERRDLVAARDRAQRAAEDVLWRAKHAGLSELPRDARPQFTNAIIAMRNLGSKIIAVDERLEEIRAEYTRDRDTHQWSAGRLRDRYDSRHL